MFELYRPRRAEHWAKIRPLLLPIVKEVKPVSWQTALAFLKIGVDFILWTWLIAGIELDTTALFTGDNVRAFVRERNDGEGTRQTHVDEARLGRLVKVITGERPQTLARQERSDASPYTALQVAAISSYATTRRTPRQRDNLTAIVALARGAGLRASEIRNLRGRDIGDGLVHITNSDVDQRHGVERTVPVLARWREDIEALVRRRDSYVVLPDIPRDWNHRRAIGSFLREFGSRRPSPRRLRTSWLVELITLDVSIRTFQYLGGFNEITALTRYTRWIPPTDLTHAIAELRHAEETH